MKTANVVSTTYQQQSASASQKNATTPLEENAFSTHFNRELSTVNNNRSATKSNVTNGDNNNSNNNIQRTSNSRSNDQNQVATNKVSDDTASESVAQSTPSSTAVSTNDKVPGSSGKDKKEAQNNDSNQDDNNPLMLLFGAMSSVPKIDLPNTASTPTNTNAEANNASISAGTATVTDTLASASAAAASALPGAKKDTSILALEDNNGNANTDPTDASDSHVAETNFSQKLANLKDIVAAQHEGTPSEGENAVNAKPSTAVSPGANATSNEASITASLQAKLEKIAVAITPQATTVATNIANIAATAAPAAAANTPIAQPFGTSGWDKAVGQKVLWMVGESIHSAELSLNPPDLGPLQVVLKVTNEHASASFMCAQPEVREALEASMPKLRQMMSDAGIQLSGFSVNTQASNQGQQGNNYRPSAQEMAQNGRIGSNLQQTEPTSTVATRPSRVFTSRIGEVDTFA
ncbi:flagellar hook-length control protein FliK [Undibacterium sp. MH2W]|uniref:flagellar hook-length control protein FliK n=1 Tax=Undibacterium sp. MH2W TaxID=3413044 RepID=UPI003BEF5FF7